MITEVIDGEITVEVVTSPDVVVEVIEEGARGPIGPQGAQGPQGEIGPPGTTNHLSLSNIGTRTHVELESDIAAKVTANSSITGATKTKITYDSKGLVTAGANLALSDLPTVGSNTQVIFNDGGVLGADGELVYNKTTNTLTTTNLRQIGTTILLGFQSGLNAFSESYVTYIGPNAGKDSLDNANSIAIGENAGAQAQGTYNLCFGGFAGYQASGAGSLLALGTNAGALSSGLNSSIAIGTQAGYQSSGSTSSLMFGPSAGAQSQNINNSMMIGSGVGQYATYDFNGPESFNAIFIGTGAGTYSINSYETIAIGGGACGNHTGYRVIGIGPFCFSTSGVTNSIGIGQYSFEQCANGDNNLGVGDYTFNYATNPQSSVAIGANAGAYSSNPTSCLFIGPSAGNASIDLTSATGIGDSALKSATSAPSSVAIGTLSLFGVLGAQATVAIGNNAGGSEFGGGYVNSSVFVGSQSGYQAYNGSDCIFIGSNSGLNDTIDNYTTYGWNILLGSNTNTGGFSNSISIGAWIANSAASQCNIGNAFYIDGIYTSATQSATPVTTAKHGFCTDTPAATLDVEGDAKLGVGGTVFQSIISATATLDFPNISSNSYEDLTMTVPGATVGASVFLGAPDALESNLTFCGWVIAADTVTIRIHNGSGGAVDPASNTWRATVINF